MVRGSSPWLATHSKARDASSRAFFPTLFEPTGVQRKPSSLTLRAGHSSGPALDAAATLVTVTRVRFPALDGYPLGGFLHVATDAAPAQAVVFATGGGIRAEVYKHFLNYLAGQGVAVLAFDYRGIGESRPAKLRGFHAGLEDWAEFDAGGAIRWMSARYPGARLTGMGHSIGALLIGAGEPAANLAQLVFIAPHVGFQPDYGFGVRWLVRLAWRVIGAPLRLAFGYFPASAMRLGEDLPNRVARQWATRTFGKVEDTDAGSAGRRERLALQRIAEIRKPALVLSISDDPWATDAGVRRFLHAYKRLLAVRLVLQPESDEPVVGHFGFFRRRFGASYWPIAARFVTATHADA